VHGFDTIVPKVSLLTNRKLNVNSGRRPVLLHRTSVDLGRIPKLILEGIPLYLIFIFGYKMIIKSKRVIPATADLISGKDQIGTE